MGPAVNTILTAPDGFVKEALDKAMENAKLEKYNELVANLKMRLPKTAKIYLFGSRVFGLSAKNSSDLDIFVDLTGNKYNSELNKDVDVDNLETIEKSLDKNWKVKAFIQDARYPVLKTTYTPMDLDCDIVASNGVAVENSYLLKHLLDIQHPQARSLCHFIRLWHDANDFEFKGYTLTLLVLFFLQHKNLMPTMPRVQRDLPAKFVGGWNVAFDAKKNAASYGVGKMTDYKDYRKEFFLFYKNYPFANYVISTYDGTSILRNQYKYKEISLDSQMAIAGPINRKYNSGTGISKKDLEKFQNACCTAIELLK